MIGKPFTGDGFSFIQLIASKVRLESGLGGGRVWSGRNIKNPQADGLRGNRESFRCKIIIRGSAPMIQNSEFCECDF